MIQAYADTPSVIKTFPIKRIASQAMLTPEAVGLDADMRWPLGRSIFNCRMKLIQHAIGEGFLIVPESTIVDVLVRARASAVPSEAGQLGAEAAMRGGSAVGTVTWEGPLW